MIFSKDSSGLSQFILSLWFIEVQNCFLIIKGVTKSAYSLQECLRQDEEVLKPAFLGKVTQGCFSTGNSCKMSDSFFLFQ